ncbi:MAG: hypothetical protein ACI4KA_03715 [Oscillospiraceae bacterium]
MKKSLSACAILLAAVMMSGCAGNNNSATGSETGSNSETSTEKTTVSSEAPDVSVPDETEEPLSFDLIGLMGEKIKPSEIVKISSVSGEQLTAADLTEDNWNYISCKGFAYAAEPTGLNYNNIDTPEMFDDETYSFKDIPEAAPNEYRRIQPGDVICGLTVTSANTDLFSEQVTSMGADPTVPGSYFSGCTVTFDGSAEMTGYLAMPPKDDYSVFEGDMFFVPEPGCNVLPVINFKYNTDKMCVENTLFINMLDDFIWTTEYPSIYAGNISTASADVSDLPQDGRYHKVKLTVDNISMRASVNWFSKIECSITELEILE